MKQQKTVSLTREFNTKATMQTASGFVTARAKGITVTVNMYLPFDNEGGKIRGSWEVYSTKDGGDSVYGEGELHADKSKKVYDYDGCFDLPSEVKTLLKEMGFNTSAL
jgi:hypothetical protein